MKLRATFDGCLTISLMLFGNHLDEVQQDDFFIDLYFFGCKKQQRKILNFFGFP
jgi:hypothetical protein